MPCAYPYFLDILDMKKKSKYRIRKNELRRFEKENKLTKKEKERLHMWVDAGHSAYDLQWLYELREEEEFDELLSGLTDAQVNYVYSYCMNWYPIMQGETKSSLSLDTVYCKDIDEMMKKLDLKVESWTFYFGNISEEVKSKIEAIQNIVGENSKFLIESTAYILHK